jgi:hypothetical protein
MRYTSNYFSVRDIAVNADWLTTLSASQVNLHFARPCPRKWVHITVPRCHMRRKYDWLVAILLVTNEVELHLSIADAFCNPVALWIEAGITLYLAALTRMQNARMLTGKLSVQALVGIFWKIDDAR